MHRLADLGRDVARVPEIEQVVVAARGERETVVRPGESADLLRVAGVRRDVRLRDAHVIVANRAVARAARQQVLVPGERRDAARVAAHLADLLLARHVPQLHGRVVRADRQVLRAARLDPRERRDAVVGRLHRAELGDGGRRRVPQVHGAAERDGEHVVRAPVHQVQVVVVEQLGRVENALGRRRDVSRHLLALRTAVGGAVRAVQHAKVVLVRLVGQRRLLAVREYLLATHGTATVQQALGELSLVRLAVAVDLVDLVDVRRRNAVVVVIRILLQEIEVGNINVHGAAVRNKSVSSLTNVHNESSDENSKNSRDAQTQKTVTNEKTDSRSKSTAKNHTRAIETHRKTRSNNRTPRNECKRNENECNGQNGS
jgi:hypothetical protein